MARCLYAALLTAMLCAGVDAGLLRLSSVLPTSYTKDAEVPVKVNSLVSRSKIMPMPWYSHPWCPIGKDVLKTYKEKQNLGEILWGNQVEPSLFSLKMLADEKCRMLCNPMTLNEKERKLLRDRIEDQYRGQILLDGLPVFEEGTGRQSALTSSVATGFPLGMSKKLDASGRTVVHNHLAFTVAYHEHSAQALVADADEPLQTYRVVGFQVQPMSVDHSVTACDDAFPGTNTANPVTPDSETISWTYSVKWVESDVEWSTRWDVYMKSTKAEARIHWVSITNAIVMVLLLTVIIALILIRLLKKDFARYNDPDAIEEERDETGWKQVHGDVFRKPEAAGLLSVYVGSGVQLLGMIVVTLSIACLGFTSPTSRGSLFTAAVFLFVILGSAAGYTTAVMAKAFQMKSWKIILMVGVFFPGTMFAGYFVLNFVHWGSHAASATPFGTMLTLAALWFCVSLPLVFFGGGLGYRAATLEFPRKVNSIARSVPPQPWYLQMPLVVLVPGVLPFGSAFIESVFILGSMWQGRIYYVFGFLGLVFLILVTTVAEATIVMVYFQLGNLDYNWWWRSFLTGASYGVWFFLYCVYYYVAFLPIRSLWSSVLYFGYMLMVSYFCAVVTGTIGFLATAIFVSKIYSALKVD